ncbi:MAG: hypothetical protein ACOC1F_02350 [Myxococcota bacterium]
MADAAHELKNPVATIRVAADTLANGSVDDRRAEARLGVARRQHEARRPREPTARPGPCGSRHGGGGTGRDRSGHRGAR